MLPGNEKTRETLPYTGGTTPISLPRIKSDGPLETKNNTHEKNIRRLDPHLSGNARCLTPRISIQVHYPHQGHICRPNRSLTYRSVVQPLTIQMQPPTRTCSINPYLKGSLVQVILVRRMITSQRRRKRRHDGRNRTVSQNGLGNSEDHPPLSWGGEQCNRIHGAQSDLF